MVGPGEEFVAGAIPVAAVGEHHAVIHPELPLFDNSGYLLTVGDDTVFHPGDALTGPGRPVDVLLAPVCAPWMKVAEGIDFARSIGAPRNVAIHDRVYSDAAWASPTGTSAGSSERPASAMCGSPRAPTSDRTGMMA